MIKKTKGKTFNERKEHIIVGIYRGLMQHSTHNKLIVCIAPRWSIQAATQCGVGKQPKQDEKKKLMKKEKKERARTNRVRVVAVDDDKRISNET